MTPGTFGRVTIAMFVAVAMAGRIQAQHAHEETAAQAAAPQAAVGDPYPLATDPVSGEKLGDRPVIIRHEGRELRFANQANAQKFRADPATYVARLDKALIADQLPRYPLETCIVAGGPLGGMGEPVNVIHNNRLVRFCCSGCIGTFRDKAAQFLSRLDAAVIEKHKKDYALKTCPVSGEDLGGMGEVVQRVVANQLVRLCCTGRVDGLNRNPAEVLAKVRGQAAPATAPAEAGHTQHSH